MAKKPEEKQKNPLHFVGQYLLDISDQLDDFFVEREELPPLKFDRPKIPGTDITDEGVNEEDWWEEEKRARKARTEDRAQRAIELQPAEVPSPDIDPFMEIPYDFGNRRMRFYDDI